MKVSNTFIILVSWIILIIILGTIFNIGAFMIFIVAVGLPIIFLWFMSYFKALWKSTQAIKMMKNLPFSPANVSNLMKEINGMTKKKKDKEEPPKEDDNMFGGMYI